jgi:hypothetical protein
MIRGSLYTESDDLKNVWLRLTSGKYALPEPYLLLDLKRTDLTIYLAPEDLPRIAGMLRLAAEKIEALIPQNGTNHEATLQPNVVLFPSEVARAA